MVGEMRFPEDKLSFPQDWPRISAVHGIFKHLDDEVVLIFEERKR